MKRYCIIPLVLQTLIWVPTKLFFKLFYNIEIKGEKNIKDADRGVLFVSNHSSELDPIIIPSCLPFLSKLMPMFYVSQKKDFYQKRKFIYGGKFFNFWGAYAVDTGKKNYEVALKKHLRIIKDKNSLCIFPEGGKSHYLDINKIKGGAAYICHKTNCPIIPVLIKILKKPKRKILVVFGKVLYVKDIFKDFPRIEINEQQNDYKEAAKFLMSKIYNLDTK
ncbi:MAG: lysophospholipid acyltransferase family protein [bacterium]|nr:lysophospholipid acyltransferase family protein [bacterium]